jgi:hypothetical protein
MALAGCRQQFRHNFCFDFTEVLNVSNGKHAHACKKWDVLSSGIPSCLRNNSIKKEKGLKRKHLVSREKIRVSECGDEE